MKHIADINIDDLLGLYDDSLELLHGVDKAVPILLPSGSDLNALSHQINAMGRNYNELKKHEQSASGLIESSLEKLNSLNSRLSQAEKKVMDAVNRVEQYEDAVANTSESIRQKKVQMVERLEEEMDSIDFISLEKSIGQLYESYQEQAGLQETKKQVLSFNDFLVHSPKPGCPNHYRVEEKNIYISRVSEDGKKDHAEVWATHCLECGAFYILDSSYKSLRKSGALLCNQLSVNGWQQWRENPQLDISFTGYTVNKSLGLTDVQRREILKTLMDENIFTSADLRNILTDRIYKHSDLPKYVDAVAKWKTDLRFVTLYKK